MMKSIKQLLQKAEDQLQKNKITSARLDAEVILYSMLNKTREWLYVNLNTKIVQSLANKFNARICKRAKHLPVAYIINHKEFFGLDFHVNKNVLIPRPETELLVEQVIAITTKDKLERSTVADIGTGSGCIAITLAKKLPRIKIIATDVSKKALAIAKRNAKRHNVSSKIKFFCGDLLKPIDNRKIDVLVANLPYLDSKMKNLLRSLNSKSLKFEPQIALKSGPNGLNLYRHFFEQLNVLKHKPTLLFIEIGARQAVEIKKCASKLFKKSTIRIIKDLAGFNRVIAIKF